MENDRIERQYQDSKDLVAYLMEKSEVSFATYIDSVYKKVLVLSAASYFESVISKDISAYATKVSGSDKRIVTLIENKAIKRQIIPFSTGIKITQINSGAFLAKTQKTK